MSNRISFLFAWYDFWVGVYYDRKNRTLYILPLPMLVIKIDCMTYYGIIGYHTKYLIGVCVATARWEALKDDPRVGFIKISKNDWLKEQ